jgi:hypothetical protein
MYTLGIEPVHVIFTSAPSFYAIDWSLGEHEEPTEAYSLHLLFDLVRRLGKVININSRFSSY